MLSYTIIYNPASGHAKGPTAAEQLKAKLEDRQRQVSMAPTKSADDARNFAYQAQSDIVVAVGGDGTINQVVAGLARSTTWLKSCIFRCCCHWRSRTF